jgi:hypothetical protein
MAVSVKQIKLWRTQVENKPGTLGVTLTPLAKAGADLQVVMGYHLHGAADRAVIEVSPVSGKKATSAAGSAGLAAAETPTLLVQGDNRPGLGHAVAQAIADAGINIVFLVAQVVDAKFSAVIAFEDEAAAKQATSLIKKAAKQVEKQASAK